MDRIENLPFRFRQMNTCDINSQMKGEDGHKKLATYHRPDLGNDGNQEPNETLVDREQHISG
jgi:hypothetical protein